MKVACFTVTIAARKLREPSSIFGAKLFARDTNKMADETDVETATTSSKSFKDEAMEIDAPQVEKAKSKGSSGAGSSTGKSSKSFELPW